MDEARVRVEASPVRCPYCRDDLDPKAPEDLAACASCGARHHAACHRQHGRCATCGHETALVAPRRGGRLAHPPAGSRIRVDVLGDTTTISWPVNAGGTWSGLLLDLLVLAGMSVTVVLLPLAAWLAYVRYSGFGKSEPVRITPDAIELPASTWWGASWRRVRIPRGDVGAVRASAERGRGVELSIDRGAHRFNLWTSFGLFPPEAEWLAERIAAWRDEA